MTQSSSPNYAQYVRQEPSKQAINGVAKRSRRHSNSLPGEPRGDTGAAAMATLNEHPTPPPTPAIPQTPSTPSTKPRHSKRRKAKSLLKRYKTISLRHTWLNPLLICSTVILIYSLNPGPHNPLHKYLFLSYPLPTYSTPSPHSSPQRLYGKGPHDFCFVAFYTIFLSFTREFLMQRLIRPIAIHYGIRSRGKQARFMEQYYTALYFLIFGPFGLYVMRYASPIWYFETKPMYVGFPHREHVGLFKAYYLLQASYWAQQAIVLCLMLEKPRKDFKELVAHHVITLVLIGLSYRFHFATMGLAVYVTHDISDFFLAEMLGKWRAECIGELGNKANPYHDQTSKVLNYLNSPIGAPYFGGFIFIWIYLRHFLNLKILYSILTEFRTVGPFELNWETQQYKCWISQYITFALLASIQALNLFWLFLIFRIAWRFVKSLGKDIKDERSDDEDEEEQDVVLQDGKEVKAPEVRVNGMPVEEKEGELRGLRSRGTKSVG
ncbi:MAG: hypothetical protein M1820_008391 [Bogoriella megaspora]|nr:MAG: hypothetical protein M1820_008391 [Bogoriella megaspora]